MDNRCGRRVAILVPVEMFFQNGQHCSGVATNISQDGIFVETNARPRRNICVDVHFIPRRIGELGVRLPALAVHGGGGLGLMFRALDEVASRSVQRLLGGC